MFSGHLKGSAKSDHTSLTFFLCTTNRSIYIIKIFNRSQPFFILTEKDCICCERWFDTRTAYTLAYEMDQVMK